MPKFFCQLIVILTCGATVACTSLRTIVDTSVPQTNSAAVQPVIAPDDALTVTMRDGTKNKIHVTASAPDFIEGTQDNDKQSRHFQFSEIVTIERREFDGVKTAILVIAIVAGLYAIAKAAAEASLASNL